MKQLCLDLLETFACVSACVCAHECGFVCFSMRTYLCLHVSVCDCLLCIIAPSHSNYKMHLIHFPI